MEFVTSETANVISMPLGVTSIDDPKSTKRTGSRTLSKAVSLHLEGKRESAAKMLTKAIDGGEHDSASVFGPGTHSIRDARFRAAAASTYAQLVALEPLHRTAHFNLAVCHGNLKNWKAPADAFRRAGEVDATRADALLGLGISLIHMGSPAQAMEPLDKYLRLFPEHEQALFGKAVAYNRPAGRRSGGSLPQGAGAQSAVRRGALQLGGDVPGAEGPRLGPAVCRDADRIAAGFDGGDGSAGHPGIRAMGII